MQRCQELTNACNKVNHSTLVMCVINVAWFSEPTEVASEIGSFWLYLFSVV